MTPLLCGTAVVLAVLVVTARRNRRFRGRFPPISDADFLARCRPGVDPAIALKVRRMVADHFAVEYERVYPSTRFVEDLDVE